MNKEIEVLTVKKIGFIKGLFLFSGSVLVIVAVMLSLVPLLREYVNTEVVDSGPETEQTAAITAEPEKELVTVIYQMEEGSSQIGAVYIEVFRPGADTVSFLQIPADTRITLSEELYASLRIYAPELSQNLKLSRMAVPFSAEYGLTGGNRILSELLGTPITDYVRVNEEQLQNWMTHLTKECTAAEFFTYYTQWLEGSESNRTTETRWMYFEAYEEIDLVETEVAAGTQKTDGFRLSEKQAREKLKEIRSRLAEMVQE